MNSPETEIFHKGDILFNFSNIKSTTSKIDNLVIVEGYMDAISLCSFGFKNVVAPLGTAMTEKQINLAWNLTDSPIICFGGADTLGMTSKCIDMLLDTPGTFFDQRRGEKLYILASS